MAGALLLHGGVGTANDFSHVVWTAPGPGLYAVAASFFDQQHGLDVAVAVLVNGKARFSYSLPNDGASVSYARLFALRTGDTVDFAVGPNLPYSGHIGLEAVISGGLTQE